MKKVYAFAANGTEEVELLAVVDVLRRAGVEVVTVSIEDTDSIVSSHSVQIKTDARFADCDFSDADALFLPGGMPGTRRLTAYAPLRDLLVNACGEGKLISAICAAPTVLAAAKLLEGKRAICFPGFESEMEGALLQTGAGVVVDGNIVTARGLGFAIDLGLKLVEIIVSAQKSEDIARAIQYK